MACPRLRQGWNEMRVRIARWYKAAGFAICARSICYSCETTSTRKYCSLLFCLHVCVWAIFLFTRDRRSKPLSERGCAMYECSRWIFHCRNKSRRPIPHFDAFRFIMDTNRGRDTRHTPKHSILCNATAPFACPEWFPRAFIASYR